MTTLIAIVYKTKGSNFSITFNKITLKLLPNIRFITSYFLVGRQIKFYQKFVSKSRL